MFTKKDGISIFIVFIVYRIVITIFSDLSWVGGGEYTFPITTLWGSYSMYIMVPYLYLSYFSLMNTNFTLSSMMKSFNTYNLYPITLHPDGLAGMKEMLNYIYSNLTKVLFLVFFVTSIFSLAIYNGRKTDPTYSSTLMIGTIIFFIDIISIICFLKPLMQIRNIFKTQKSKQQEIFFEKIKNIDEKCKKEELQELNELFNVIKNINQIPEWGFDTKKWIYIVGQVLLTFVPLFLK